MSREKKCSGVCQDVFAVPGVFPHGFPFVIGKARVFVQHGVGGFYFELADC
jgi:hypothetical protein